MINLFSISVILSLDLTLFGKWLQRFPNFSVISYEFYLNVFKIRHLRFPKKTNRNVLLIIIKLFYLLQFVSYFSSYFSCYFSCYLTSFWNYSFTKVAWFSLKCFFFKGAWALELKAQSHEKFHNLYYLHHVSLILYLVLP